MYVGNALYRVRSGKLFCQKQNESFYRLCTFLEVEGAEVNLISLNSKDDIDRDENLKRKRKMSLENILKCYS